jgi:hypothetical protein
MKLVRIILFFALIIGYSSCKKKVVEYNPDLVGLWMSENNGINYIVTIVDEGKSTYYEDWDTAYVETRGVAKIRVKKKDNDILVIGKKDFTITEDGNMEGADIKYPTSVVGLDPHLQLVLNGIVYRKEE